MKETYIKEFVEIQPNNPILIEGLPGLGLVGKITLRYMIRQLHAKKIAYLYSPHFPYFVLVNKKGNVRLLRGAFYYYKNPNGQHDIILFTGDSQSQTIKGQYEIADQILVFSEKYNVKTIATIGGYRMEPKEKPKVFIAATSQEILDKALNAGAYPEHFRKPYCRHSRANPWVSKIQENRRIMSFGRNTRLPPDPLSPKVSLKF